MSFTSAFVLYTHRSIGGKAMIYNELDKLISLSPSISAIYISHGDVHKAAVKRWCIPYWISLIAGTNYITTNVGNYGQVCVVYIGKNIDTIEYRLAQIKANDLRKQLIIFP